MELVSHSWIDCLTADRALGEIKSREVELVSRSWIDCLTADRAHHRSRAGRWSWAVIAGRIVLLLNYSSTAGSLDTACMSLFRTAVETAVSGVPELLGTGGVPTSLTLLFWRWLTVSSVFAGCR